MRILVTNDDGIEAAGIEALARCALLAGHDVSVLAPLSEMSGTGASMGPLALHNPIEIRRWSLPSLGDIPVHAAEATPAACAILGCLGVIGAPPELVLSGVNAGFNVGRSALHSGTVGAALTAAAWGVKGIAVSTSTAAAAEVYWDTAASVAVDLATWFMEDCDGQSLNVNVPNLPPAGLLGVRWATLAPVGAIRSFVTGVEETADHSGLRVLTDHLRTDPEAAPQGSDRKLVAQGYVTLTGLGGLAQWTPSGDSLDEGHLAGLLRSQHGANSSGSNTDGSNTDGSLPKPASASERFP